MPTNANRSKDANIKMLILPNVKCCQRSLFAFGLALIANDPRCSYLAGRRGRVFRLILHTENQQCHYQRDTTANGHTQPPFNITLCNPKCTVELVIMHRYLYFYANLLLSFLSLVLLVLTCVDRCDLASKNIYLLQCI